ncbi:enoyl-CoA hydratase/isomerase family protein [Roseovarius sp. Pro17]|uniref:enoyl-CoA hydratase/isomerase family protein n=1 Tax=Roseovarius sp. Pro17 TaxID=3108175 RepID=UPI002D79BAF0|nr:enoyl-CoA hydratase/isomerase family protein [Roseovarius sp. Pro17]
MSDIDIRIEGHAGRITLNRPAALNALTYDMVLGIESVIDEWREADIGLVMIDAVGTRAFCAGGDIADMYRSGQANDLTYGRQFWRDEYRLNAKLFEFPKPVVSFMQGFTMGGGVGIGCHGSHRIVGESSRIAMPECGIGLVPDVGGSLILASCPGHLGEYLGLTGTRMGAGDAIYAGFADGFIREAEWETVKARLVEGDIDAIEYQTPPNGRLLAMQADIDRHFAGKTLGEIERGLLADTSDFAAQTLKTLRRHAPLAMGCCLQIVRRLRGEVNIRPALDLEYRFAYRAVAQGDFIEGIRAAIIDKDRSPNWAHATISDLSIDDVDKMLMPLGVDALAWEETT